MKYFLEAGASLVTVVSQDFRSELVELASRHDRVRLIKARVPDDMDSIKALIGSSDLIVIASSDPEANEVIVREALRLSKLVNNATNALRGNVIVPFRAKLYDGIYLAVTSLGRAGVAARRVLERIVEDLSNDTELETLFKVMASLKDYLKTRVSDTRLRVRLYFEIDADPEFRSLVAKGSAEEAYERGVHLVEERLRRLHSQEVRGFTK